MVRNLMSAARNQLQDLDLRLGRSKSVTQIGIGAQADTIVVEDDDDEVRISSPRSVALARFSASSRMYGVISVPVLEDEELELRLGRTGTGASAVRSRIPAHEMEQRFQDKRKHVQPAVAEPSKQIKLICAICMDSMKEETSTICGHLFCRTCIMGAIQVQKRCPICRRKLSTGHIHRIYISSNTS